MARHFKKSLDYFPLDLNLEDEIELLEAKYGLEGFALWIKLLMKIYSSGYYYSWTDREQLLFAKHHNIEVNIIINLVSDCIGFGLFDADIFKKYHVLTSRGIQKRYFNSVSRRKRIEISRETILIDIEKYIPVGENIIYVDINHSNACRSTQSKVKESKVKKIPTKINVDINKNYLPFAHRLLELHLEIDPAFIGRKSSNGFLDTSANSFRLLVERDGRNRKEIEMILEWCKRDEFWCSVIQSGGGFRRNYAQMKAQWQRKAKKEEVEMEKAGFTLEEDKP